MHRLLLEWNGAAIASYGVLVAGGYLAGALWLMSQRERMHLTVDEFWLLCYSILAGAIVGAKLGYYLVEWRAFAAAPIEMLSDWRTGWVFWSGFAGTTVAGWLYQRVYNRLYRPGKAYLPVADYFGAALALGHSIGRLGCLAEGCCHGRPTALPWGIRFEDPGCSVERALLGVPLHPVQLYESAGALTIALFLMFYVLPRIRAGKFSFGVSFFGYVGLYSILRFSLEFFRGDDRGAFLWDVLSPSQWWSLAGLAVAAYALRRFGIVERHSATRSFDL